MGACGNQENKSTKQKQIPYDKEPQDTESFKNIPLPILAFYVLISKIKIKKCNYDFISLKFKIEEVHEYATTLQQIDQTQKAYWKMNYVFDFFMDEYHLRKKFLIIEAFSKSKQLVGSLKINMFAIWTGPYHLDFKFELAKAPLCRLCFNFKISQGINLRIQTLRVRMIPLEKKFPQDKFSFTLRANIGQHLDKSNYSYHVCVKQDPHTKHPAELLQTKFVDKQKIEWQREVGDEMPLPLFDKNVAYYQIYSSSLHLTFWKVLPKLQESSDVIYQIQSQCYISLAKLMRSEYKIIKDSVNQVSYLERDLEVQEKIWLHGKEMGSATIGLKFMVQSHLKQMQACVRTQSGILTSSPVFSNTNQKTQCDEIEALRKLNDEVQRQFIRLEQNTQKKNNFIMTKENMFRISNLLSRELTILKQTSKQSILFYEYKNEQELTGAQGFLIDFAFKILTFIHEDRQQIQEISWEILAVILKRGEFKLSHLNFTYQQQNCVLNKNISPLLHHRIDVALNYQELLNHLLKQALHLLQFKSGQAQRQFVQSFLSYAYFRIPQFREQMLLVINKDSDPEIAQWRGTQFDLYHQGEEQKDDFYSNLFDWENKFYKVLLTEEKYLKNHIQLEIILAQDKWKNRLASRGGAFYKFLQNLAKQIQYVSVVSKYIKWQSLPGYTKLLHAFLVEMKSCKISNYTQDFKKCLVALLSNQKILNIFVAILLMKTNSNETDTIYLTFQIIDDFFRSIKENHRSIPGTFDYKFFFEGMKVVIEGQFQYNISQVLLLIYNHIQLFSQDFKLQIQLYLLSNPFYKLFFHWSHNLRHIFHTFFYCKIARLERAKLKQKGQISQKNDRKSEYNTNVKQSISQRYIKLMQTIQKQIYPQPPLRSLASFHEIDLFKKMRFLLFEKRRAKSTEKLITNPPELNQPIPQIKSARTLSSSTRFTPQKFIFVQDEETVLTPIYQSQFPYIKQAITQYNIIADQLQISYKINPEFNPYMKVKKIIDEKEIKPLKADQW